MAMLDRWVVIITGPKLVDDIRKLPDDQVSFNAALSDVSILQSLQNRLFRHFRSSCKYIVASDGMSRMRGYTSILFVSNSLVALQPPSATFMTRLLLPSMTSSPLPRMVWHFYPQRCLYPKSLYYRLDCRPCSRDYAEGGGTG